MTNKKEEQVESNKSDGKTLSLSGKTLSLGAGSVSSSSKAKVTTITPRRKRLTPAAPSQASKVITEDTHLTSTQKNLRAKALQAALEGSAKKKELPKRRVMTLEDKKALEAEEIAAKKLSEEKELSENTKGIIEDKKDNTEPASTASKSETKRAKVYTNEDSKPVESYRDKIKKSAPKPAPRNIGDRRGGRITITQALNKDYERDRGPSLAAQKRMREKARLAAQPFEAPQEKRVCEVILPETITVQELSNRMAETGKDVVKALMKMGVMATGTQVIDADTAELIIEEFGHRVRRVTDADVEIGLDDEDKEENLLPRPPVVTIMGHVDHGKTSLLDALRLTDVVAGEAGGITQHIGAYQVELSSGDKITFLDTPGHAAFTKMRARGANVTDIVVIVVAANDSIMPQTIEAINHAKAANVPIIIAVNKIDLPDANPTKVKQDLLQHEVVIEDMGGEVQCVEISAKKKINLDKLEEAILLQSEMLEIKANPNRDAQGFVVESKVEKGRGSVATVLIQKGTLRVGHVFVAGATFGKVRAIIDDKGKHIKEALPGQPVEILGSNSTPSAGDIFNVTSEESKAREIAEYRQSKNKEIAAAKSIKSRTTMEQLLELRAEGEKTKLPVLIRADVYGSIEAITGSLAKMEEENEGIEVQILHTGVGGITESDVILANASGALIIGFNVRANMQARELAEHEKVDIRYYNIIYNVIDDAKALLTGMLAPTIREEYIGQAIIKEVFNITKVGKVAGCEVSKGGVKRGSKVRLLRDDVVIHEGMLKTLKRFKEEVKDVKEGQECGMAFENYDDIKANDIIECYEIIEEERVVK